jgi:hypothetical protein
MFSLLIKVKRWSMNSNVRFLNTNISKIIDSTESKEAKYKILIFLSQLFNKFQKIVANNENIRAKDLINYRQSFKSRNDRNEDYKIFQLINNHDQFKNCFDFISNNFDCFNSKEIAFISKVYNSISLDSDENDPLRSKIKEYCLLNIQKFDLYDIENITFNYRIYTQFILKSLDFVGNKINDTEFVSKKLNIDKYNGYFENEMFEIDSKQKIQLWLRLNVFLSYRNYFKSQNFKSLIESLFEKSAYLTKNELNIYETNFIITLCSESALINNASGLNRSIIQPFIDKDFLLKLFDKFELLKYKEDLHNFMLFYVANVANEKKDFEDVLKQFQNLISNTVNSHLFFTYSRILNSILYGYSKFIRIRRELDLSRYDILRSIKYDKYYNYLVENLDDEFKSKFQKQLNKFIEKEPIGPNFMNASESIILFSLISQDSSHLLNKFYAYLFKFYSNLVNNTNDLHYYHNTILNLLHLLIGLNNESSKVNEIELSNKLKLDLNVFYNSNDNSNKTNLVAFFMLNEKTLFDNFEFISKELKNISQISNNNYNLAQIIFLLEKRKRFILNNYKNDFVDIVSLILEFYVTKMIDFQQYIKAEDSELLINIKIKTLIQYLDKNVKIITIDDKNKLFSFLKEIELNLNDHVVENFLFDNDHGINRIGLRLSIFVKFFKTGNFYLLHELDKIWKFLVTVLDKLHKLELPTDIKIKKFCDLNKIMSIYSHFDFTFTYSYKKDKILLEALNNKFYNEILRNKLDIDDLIVFVENLISLDLFVENAFTDLVEINVRFSKIHILF